MSDPRTFDFPGRQHVLPRPSQARPRPIPPPPAASTPTRVAPQCEMRGCPNRADYFWHWLVRPIVGWVPICQEDVDGFLDTGWEGFIIAPIAETSDSLYRGSDHRAVGP